MVIRYETDGDTVYAVREDENGNRWYEPVLVNGEVLW
jgi:hypothetical protein